MDVKVKLKEFFEIESEYGGFYTGGSVAWTSNGKELICLNNTKINIVSTENNKVISTLSADIDDNGTDDDSIYTFALSIDNEKIVSAHKSGLIQLWSKTDGKLIKQWNGIHQGPIVKLAFGLINSEKEIIASGGSDSKIRIWDYMNKMCIAGLRGCIGVISVLEFVPTTKLIMACGDDYKINCWNYETKTLVYSLVGHYSKVTSLSFTLDNKCMVSSSRDKVLILWSLETGKQIRIIPVFECIETVIVLPIALIKLPVNVLPLLQSDNYYALTAGEKGTVQIFDLSQSKIIYEQTNSLINNSTDNADHQTNGNASITQLLFNQTLNQIAIISSDHNIIIHNLSTFYCSNQLIGFSDDILDCILFGKNDKFLALATNSCDIKIYDTNTMNCKIIKGHTDFILSLASFRNFLLSASKDCSIRLWEINCSNFTIKQRAYGKTHTSAVGSVTFGKLSHTLCASVSQDTCLKVWSIPKQFNNEDGDNDGSDDNKLVNLNCIITKIVHEKDINCVTISPNDTIIATASQDKTAKIWNIKDLQLIGVFRGHKRGIWCVKFSPVDQLLLTSSADCTMRLWSLVDMSCVRIFEGHESSILKADFLNKGLQLLSTGSDGLIKIWSIKTSECINTLARHEQRVWSLAISKNEKYFYSGGSDALLLKWIDVTLERKLTEQKLQQTIALEEQELTNLMNQNKLFKALKIALKLEKPHLTLKIINNIIQTENTQLNLNETIKKLNDSCKENLLKHSITWNTNSKNCLPAQLVLNILLPDIVNGTFRPNGLHKIIEELLPYTERHFRRATEYLKDFQILEYTLNSMQIHSTVPNFDT